MRRLWAKFVVASLIILGEGAFASEISQRSDERHENDANTAVISQDLFQDDYGLGLNPSSACIDIDWPKASLARLNVIIASVVSLDSSGNYPFNPRAPPIPAS